MLTNTKIKQTKPGDKTIYLSDTTVKGLRVEIRPNGSRLWRLRYTKDGKQRLTSLGSYPEVSLKLAREKATDLRAQVASGKDPITEKRRGGTSVQDVGDQWFNSQRSKWVDGHAKRIRQRLSNEVYPVVGGMEIGDVTAPDVLRVANRLVDRGSVETAHKVVGIVGSFCRFSIGLGLRTDDPTVHLKGVVKPSPKSKHRPALTNVHELREFTAKLDEHIGNPIGKAALWTVVYTAMRSGTVRNMKWSQVDLDKKEWTVTAADNKTAVEMIVCLPTQLVEILLAIQPLSNGDTVFPGEAKGGLLSEVYLINMIKSLGYDTKTKVSPHGFRASLRTVGAEVLKFPPHVLETALLHVPAEAHGRAYNRTLYLEERHDLAQQYANLIDPKA